MLAVGFVNAEDVNDTAADDSVKSYTDLSDKISNASDNSVVELEDNYRYDSQADESFIDGVKISKNITLSGKNDNYIDGNYSAKCLYIDSNCSVVLENLTFKNGYSTSNAGAIFLNSNSKLILKNCKFLNNKVYNANGGALCCYNSTNTEIYNCIFSNNTSIRVSDLEWKQDKKGMGSAICTFYGSNLTLCNTTLKDNNGYLTTILVVSYNEVTLYHAVSTLTVKGCLFENNIAYSSGVIYLDELGQGEILDTVFRNNTATNSGSPIILDACYSALVKNCLFDGNSGLKGGAIHIKVFEYDYRSNVTIEDCNFTKNTASEYGGAIFSKYGLTKIFNCNFIENTAAEYGGAIFTKLGELTVLNCSFTSNSAQYGGGLFLRDEKVTVDDSVFTSNKASVKGGAVYSKIEDVTSSACVYSANSAPVASDVFGGFNAQVTKIVSYFSDIELTVKLSSLWNMPLSQNIKLKFTSTKNYKTGWLKTDSNGMLTLKVPLNIPAGTYTLTIQMENGVCFTNPSTITVSKAPSKITVSKLTTKYQAGKKYNIHVTNTKTNKAVANAKLTLKVYTGSKYVSYTVKTDSNGLAQFDTSGLSGGTHKIIITAANSNIKVSKTTSSIKVKKATGILLISKKKVKRPAKIKIKVKNKASGKVISKTKFKVYTSKNAKAIKVKTNAKGVLKISTKKLSKGSHKIRVVLKNTNYKINKKVKVKIK